MAEGAKGTVIARGLSVLKDLGRGRPSGPGVSTTARGWRGPFPELQMLPPSLWMFLKGGDTNEHCVGFAWCHPSLQPSFLPPSSLHPSILHPSIPPSFVPPSFIPPSLHPSSLYPHPSIPASLISASLHPSIPLSLHSCISPFLNFSSLSCK